MMYTELNIGNETYKLRLTTKSSVALEKSLGYNPIEMFLAVEQGRMPKLGDMLIILQAMLQPLHHGINMDKTYDLFDQYIEDGKNMYDLIPVFIEVFQESGFMPKNSGEIMEETEGKN